MIGTALPKGLLNSGFELCGVLSIGLVWIPPDVGLPDVRGPGAALGDDDDRGAPVQSLDEQTGGLVLENHVIGRGHRGFAERRHRDFFVGRDLFVA